MNAAQGGMAPPNLTRGYRFARWLRSLWGLNLALGVISVSTLAFLWQFAEPLGIPGLKDVPPPSAVVVAATDLLVSEQYWTGWLKSFQRIGIGFLIAQFIGIPLGLAMAISRGAFGTIFPIIEILRPIPPVAWIPISIVFWPTREQSVIFIVFLGAFWIVLLNTIGGASNIDSALQAGRSVARLPAARPVLEDHLAGDNPFHRHRHGSRNGDFLGNGRCLGDDRGRHRARLSAVAVVPDKRDLSRHRVHGVNRHRRLLFQRPHPHAGRLRGALAAASLGVGIRVLSGKRHRQSGIPHER